jgi:hypothetical protein
VAFQSFLEDLYKEMKSIGADTDLVDESEAFELFLAMQEEYAGLKKQPRAKAELEVNSNSRMAVSAKAGKKEKDVRSILEDIKDEWREDGFDIDDFDDFDESIGMTKGDKKTKSNEDVPQRQSMLHKTPSPQLQLAEAPSQSMKYQTGVMEYTDEATNFMTSDEATNSMTSLDDEEWSPSSAMSDDMELEELRRYLPTFSDKRLVKVLRTFKLSLRDPSLIDLVMVVRERMPDYLTNTWLKKMSSLTARYVAHKAQEEGLVDIHMLNSYMEIESAAGNLVRALEFYETGYVEAGIAPTGYTDRLVIQMLLKNVRFNRALQVKSRIEESGRTLDLLAYGSLIDYCGRHGQLGSAVLLLKECLQKHGAKPGEAYLKHLRMLSRINDLDSELDLVNLIGEDPVAWLRDGEANLKRENSKKGRRDVLLARNALLRL